MVKKRKITHPKRIRILNNTQIILQEIANQLAWAFSRENYLDYGLYCERQQRRLQREEREYLRALKRRKVIEAKKIGKRLIVRLTEKGWNEALRDRIKTTNMKCKNSFCFVIFDVPEQEKVIRNLLRSFLKECGFIKLQQSVWMTDRDVAEPLKQLLQRKKLEHWIRIIVGDIIVGSVIDRLRLRANYRLLSRSDRRFKQT